MRFLAPALAVALFAAGTASAHTSYLLPNSFSTQGDVVTIVASFTEDFFTPEIAVLSDDFHVVKPDGTRDVFDTVQPFKQLTLLESDLPDRGTYRFTTGVRLGRQSTLVKEGDAWRPLEPGQEPSPGAETQKSQTETVADVYVTRGAPTRTAVDAHLGRLEIHAVTHPSEIFMADGFTFELLFDGKPLANKEMVLFRGGYAPPRFEQPVKTDAAGRVTLSFDQAGVYLVMTRHAAEAPAGSETAMRSYTTSLTFEVSP